MSKRISLHVLGLSYTQLQSGAYALVLAEDKGPRRIPVVIGAAEAQSIAIALEGIHPPRPMTHDLFVSFAHAFGVKLKEVYIYRFEDGIFSSELTFSDGERTVVIDARTSDAVAIAIRTGTPIFTTPEIVEQTGFIIDDSEFTRRGELDEDQLDTDDDSDDADTLSSYHADPRPENYTIEQLEQTLAELIEKEDYEEAARISEILRRKQEGSADSSEPDNTETI
ncbi:MAG: DUF151 domain-containing protein [Muribaculaceae bacterium]|nr:DUF151 domain-containing protein [Muribaculaceae bacterium]